LTRWFDALRARLRPCADRQHSCSCAIDPAKGRVEKLPREACQPTCRKKSS
jgi:hypothetical protein